MAWVKYKADKIFTGTELLNGNHVLITDGAGKVEAIVTAAEAGEDVQHVQGILSPGLINCHCHLELSHMRGLLPEKTGLVDFVFKVVTQRHFAEDEILAAIQQAENEMLANGIVAVGDICNNTLTLPQKLKQRLLYYNFIEVSGWMPNVAATRFARSKAFYDSFQSNAAGVYHALVPHAPYSVSEELWQMMQPFFAGKTITIHNQETAFEDALFKHGSGDFMRMYRMMNMDSGFFKPTGKTSLQSYYPKLREAKNVVLVHNTFTGREDLLFLHQRPVYLCLCINANLYIENTVPPVDMFIQENCRLVLGTDSLASNHSLNLLDEMKSIRKYSPQVGVEQLLQWATINGAKALNMEDKLGSFEKGKQPGIICMDENMETVKRLA
ncbi:amidohydrolase family protein [Foetidibacter luteolus]|uniref:amidohydrolase family protein n=1 Tax=Foetidibacter luteolus TaxID=2608880 RepID=UPI00129B7935|nr:amidohydrolase family protein [Foetidibacter luteolus]